MRVRLLVLHGSARTTVIAEVNDSGRKFLGDHGEALLVHPVSHDDRSWRFTRFAVGPFVTPGDVASLTESFGSDRRQPS